MVFLTKQAFMLYSHTSFKTKYKTMAYALFLHDKQHMIALVFRINGGMAITKEEDLALCF